MALDDGRVVSNFVAQALTDQDLTVYGDGQQTRSFQYVSDLIKGKRASMPLPVSCPVVLCPGAEMRPGRCRFATLTWQTVIRAFVAVACVCC